MPAATTERRSAPAAPRAVRTSAVVAVLSLCGTLVALQQTLVVPLLPDFPRLLSTSADNVSWLVTATLLTSAVATPIVARLADMFGKRRMLVLCMLVVVAGSVLAAVGTSFEAVVAGRALQGFGSALIPVGISIMRDELPREKVAPAVALMSATLGIGAAIGLPLSGVIYEHLGWHAIFWVSAATAALLLVAVVAVVPESAIRTRGRFDYTGAVLLSAALTCLLLAISKGGHWGWTSEPTLVLFVAAAVVLVVWVPFELRVSQPLVDIQTSLRKPVLLTNVASVLMGFAMFGNMLATTQQLQLSTITGYGFGTSVIVAGLCMLPGGLAMVVLAPVSATIIKRYGARAALIVGALVVAGGYIARVFLTNAIWQVVLGATLVSMGTAIAYAAMPTLIMRAVPITETASANGLNTLLRAVGTSTSSAAIGVILTSTTMAVGGIRLPTLEAFQHSFWLAAAASLAAAAVALALPGRGAAAGASPAPDQEEIKSARDKTEIVVRGQVVRDDDQPIRHAVVTVLRTDGQPADWSRADNEGHYSVVLPGPGPYVVVSSADGWAPRSDIVHFSEATTQHLTLSEQLCLSGTVTRSGTPLAAAMVSLTRPTGESVGSVHADDFGRYSMPLPPTGRYILTVVDADARWARSRQVVLLAAQSHIIDADVTSDRPLSRAPAVPGSAPARSAGSP
ncbi:MFS transporter [Actinoplanes sp. NPDC051475]|uniref:MFS transporter n=1 Tax=Actinoplanes sp. NPDC051475 TaxID=3157225 RepID=UPI00344F424D